MGWHDKAEIPQTGTKIGQTLLPPVLADLHPDKLDAVRRGRLNGPRVAVGDEVPEVNPSLGVWLASAHGVGLAQSGFQGKDAGARARHDSGNAGFHRKVATRGSHHFPCGGAGGADGGVADGRRDGAWPCELPSTLPSWSYSTSSTQPLAVHESPPRADFPDGWPSLL